MNLDNVIAERARKTVYRDGQNTIKLFEENYPTSNVLNEALNQARVEENTDINIPNLVEVCKVENRWALVSEYVEGTPLDKLIAEYPEKEDEYLNLFVDTQLNILSKNVPMLNRLKEKYKRKINEEQSIDYNTKYELLQRLEGYSTHSKVCHGDYNPSNVIVKEDGSVAILDWAHVTKGNASADIANTYLLFIIDGKKDLAEKYISLISEKSKISRANIQRWIPIVAAVRLTYGNPNEEELLRNFINVVDFG